MTPDLASRPREWLIARVIELESLLGGEAGELLPLGLPPIQQGILAALYKASPRPLTKDFLLEVFDKPHEWDGSFKVHLSHLRANLAALAVPVHIHRVSSPTGYFLSPAEKANLKENIARLKEVGVHLSPRSLRALRTAHRNKLTGPQPRRTSYV